MSALEQELGARMERLTTAIEALERSCTAEQLEPARDITRAVLDVHEAGLRLLLEQLDTHAPGARGKLERDPAIVSLLAMHGLCGETLQARVLAAIAEANQRLSAQASVELLAIDATTEQVRVRVSGREAAGRELMRRSIERLIAERAPDAQVEVQGADPVPSKSLIPIERLHAKAR